MTPERDPSLHISRSKLIQVLQELEESNVFSSNIALTDLARRIIARGSKYSLTTRGITITNEKVEKKVEKLASALKEDSVLFSNTFYLLRKKRKHVGVTLITPTHRDWPTLKMVTELANDFCSGFGFTNKKLGYTEYINEAMDIIGSKISITRFPSIHERLCDGYQSKKAVKEDHNSGVTDTLCRLYNKRVLDMTGISMDVASKPADLGYFVEAAKECVERGVSAQVYMDAQFDGLSFTNTIPYPSQISGNKAVERLARYLSKTGIRTRKTSTQGSWLDLSKLKR